MPPPAVANRGFFRTFWPVIGPAITAHRGGAAEDILPLLRRLKLPPGARILDVPCGFGRHSLLLARCGYRVTGVDISPELLARARRQAAAHSLPIAFRRGNMRRLSGLRGFDLLLNLFTSFGYFGDAGDRIVLQGFYRALRPGGWLVMHLINRDLGGAPVPAAGTLPGAALSTGRKLPVRSRLQHGAHPMDGPPGKSSLAWV